MATNKSKFKILDEKTVSELGKKYKYYRYRWTYYSDVAKLLRKLKWNSCLELGPHRQPMVNGSDTMDIKDTYFPVTIKHNAMSIPWPFEDKQYDIFIALQVWEHLDSFRDVAFKEVIRISKQAILSFPYKWRLGNRRHKGITRKIIDQWTGSVKPDKIIVSKGQKIRNRPRQNRIIYYWNFEK